MNVKKNGIAIEPHVPKDKSLLYEFTKQGTAQDGYVRAYIFTPHRSDFNKLKKQGYTYVEALEVERVPKICRR